MPDDYSHGEIMAMRPTCPNCGSDNTRVRAVPAGDLSKKGERYIPGGFSCMDCRGLPKS